MARPGRVDGPRPRSQRRPSGYASRWRLAVPRQPGPGVARRQRQPGPSDATRRRASRPTGADNGADRDWQEDGEPMTPEYLTVTEFAALLRLPRSSVYEAVAT